MDFPIFFGRNSGEFSENADEITFRAELQVIRDVADRIFSEDQKIFRRLDPLFLDVLGNRDPNF